ncbi:type III-B CRISPR module RAMP protein Cmr1 [Sulfobacillus thermotolerans]|uniref:Type III-B CRISPR module RAMP protein Cmr1 n=1 Tax=Sulfobacillus thermotolerans TaxID=338644 RepID=A0ABN5H1D6_9FIRM|nr:type III-B CRISPR module RAMP protein Cmr1 [Sulfobacillus thermotolerans]
MHKIVARFELTTPSFLGGMDPNNATDPVLLRGASLRGVLRFWWRAYMFSVLGQDLKKLHEYEDKLFGSSEKGTGRVQIVSVQTSSIMKRELGKQFIEKKPGLKYLSYGAANRQAIMAPLEFDLTLAIRSAPDDSVNKALMLLGTLGGIGARSRRGWGSLSLLSLQENGREIWRAPETVADLATFWKTIAEESLMLQTSLPSFTALSSRMRIYVLEEGEAVDLLNLVGTEFQRYRSFGLKGKLGNEDAEQNFKDDHDAMQRAVVEKEPPHKAPKRTIFGLPHNYQFSSAKGAKLSITSSGQRRASPLFFHIQKLGTHYAAVAAIIPATFLNEPTLTIMMNPRQTVSARIESYYDVIEQFITGKHRHSGTARFPKEVCIWP